MRVYVGAGWQLHHLTDRVVELRKESAVYRRFTDKDGFVRIRVEPQMSRDQALQRAIAEAMKQDEALSLRVARQLIPSGRALEQYRAEQRRLAPAFATPEDPEIIGRKRV